MFHWPNVGISSGIHVGSVSTAGCELHPVPGPGDYAHKFITVIISLAGRHPLGSGWRESQI